MNVWIRWTNKKTGSKIERAHAVIFTTDNRTMCGRTVGDLWEYADKVVKCYACVKKVSRRDKRIASDTK